MTQNITTKNYENIELSDELVHQFPKLYHYFRSIAITTKEELLEEVDKIHSGITNRSKIDFSYSSFFFHRQHELLDELKSQINYTTFFELPEGLWEYKIVYDVNCYEVLLIHYEGDGNFQVFTLLKAEGTLLTVEEYANRHHVTPVAVRQWIRRGKLRNAIKYGKEWRIPELEEITSRGYQNAEYHWAVTLSDMPESFINYSPDVTGVKLSQDKNDKKTFHIIPLYGPYHRPHLIQNQPLDNGINICDENDFLLDKTELEKLEYYLIAHPMVKYIDAHSHGFGQLSSSIIALESYIEENS